MPILFPTPAIVCRPALPSDKPAVLEFTKFIWDGHDYIKYVWDDWLADPLGLFAVAEYHGRAVALGKATFVASGQWWLEGLRVDPQLQGFKIGSHIFKYLDDWQSMQAPGTFRLMTSWERVQVQHLCDRFGWRKIGEVKSYMAHPISGPAETLRPVSQDEVQSALAFASAHLDHSSGLMNLNWKFAAPDEPTLADMARQRRLYWWRGGQALLACWQEEDEDEDEQLLGVGLIAGPMQSLAAILTDVRHLVHQLGRSSVLWQAPVMHSVETALDAAGYDLKWDGSAYLYEKK